MRLEKSCGAVVYKEAGGRRLYLIERTRSGHTSIPKGHVEGSETELQTALREIKEETNLNVAIDEGFRFFTHYTTRKGLDKEFVVFTAVPLSEELKPQESEVSELVWMEFKDALAALEYEAHKEALIKAEEYLSALNCRQGR